MRHWKRMLVMLLALSVYLCAGSAALAAYPEKQITVLQGFKPGGGSDTLAQLTQPYLEKIVGQSFINQYIPGRRRTATPSASPTPPCCRRTTS